MRMGGDGTVSESSTEVATIIGMVFTILSHVYPHVWKHGDASGIGGEEEPGSGSDGLLGETGEPAHWKNLGNRFSGVTQLAIWAILGGILFSGVSLFLASPEQAAVMSADMGELDMEGIMSTVMGISWLEIGFYFLLFFIGGYVLYAAIFAMFASAVDSEEDTTQFMTPVTLIIVFAFFAGFYSVGNPDGPLAFWASLIPFSSRS